MPIPHCNWEVLCQRSILTCNGSWYDHSSLTFLQLLIFTIDQELEEEVGMMVILTCSIMLDDPERWRRMVVHLLQQGEALRSLKMILSLSFCPWLLSNFAKPKETQIQKRLKTLIGFDTSVASVWKSDSQVMLVLTDVFLSQNKSVCALPQICFTSADKYTLHSSTCKYISLYFKIGPQICLFGPTNMFTKCINIPVQLTGFWLSNSI